MRRSQLETLRHRLREWVREQNTNFHGMAHLAERAIKVIRQEIAFRERYESRDGERNA